MKRECHVRFCEGGGVKLPSATRPVVGFQHEADAKRFLAQLREQRCGEAHGLLEYVHYARASDQERGHQELARAFALENRVCETRHVARRSGNPIGHDDYRVCSGIGLVR